MQRTKESSLTAASRANHNLKHCQAHELRNNNLDTKTCMKRVFLTCFQFETWQPLCHSNESHLNSDENITHTSLHVICLSHPYFPILAVFFCGWITADVWARTTIRTEAAHPWLKKHHVACKALWKTIIQPTSRRNHKLFIGWNETCWYNIKKCQLSAKSRWPIRSLKNTTKHKHQLLLPASD